MHFDRKSLAVALFFVVVVSFAFLSTRSFRPSNNNNNLIQNDFLSKLNYDDQHDEDDSREAPPSQQHQRARRVQRNNERVASCPSMNQSNSPSDAAVRRRSKESPFKRNKLFPESELNPINTSSSSSSSKRRSRKLIISYVDDDRGNSVGVMYGALSRLCYAQQYGYHAILYNDRDLDASIFPTKLRRHERYANEKAYHRMWSKCFLMEYTFNKFNLTADDWVFWLDSDTAITNPTITLESIIAQASVRHVPLGGRTFKIVPRDTPELLIANTVGGINNGVFAMRATPWSRKFLHEWWFDQNSNQISADNGPFMHTVLRFMAINNGIKYKGECHAKTNATFNLNFTPFSECCKNYTKNIICKGDSTNCISRIPLFVRPYDMWAPKWLVRRDYDLGFLIENDPKIGGHARINNGIDWRPAALWTEDIWLLHLAGNDHFTRNYTLQIYVKRFGNRFRPKCF